MVEMQKFLLNTRGDPVVSDVKKQQNPIINMNFGRNMGFSVFYYFTVFDLLLPLPQIVSTTSHSDSFVGATINIHYLY